MTGRSAALALVAMLAACATAPEPPQRTEQPNPFLANRGTAPAPPAPAAHGAPPPEGRAAGGLDFGAWRSADPATYAPAFETQVRARIANLDRAGVRIDLERNGFVCGEAGAVLQCRIEIMEQGCARDWYVVLDGASAEPNVGFDVMCLGAN